MAFLFVLDAREIAALAIAQPFAFEAGVDAGAQEHRIERLRQIVLGARFDAADHAVDLVDRIRKDEAVHVAWLRAAISEFRSFTVKTVDGDRVRGADILDPVWAAMVHWHGVEMHEVNRPAAIADVRQKLMAQANGDALYQQFEALAA